MKSKGGNKKAEKKSPVSQKGKPDLKSTPAHDHRTDDDNTDDDLPEEHIKNLDEALKGADRGEPVTLNEFKRMAKKWGKESQKNDGPKKEGK